MIIYKLLLYFDIFLGAVYQLMLKRGMNKEGVVDIRLNQPSFKKIIFMYLNPLILLGTIIYAISLILWVVILSKIDLSYAYPLASLNYPFVAFLSQVLFKEKVSRLRWLSIAIIVLGVILVSLS